MSAMTQRTFSLTEQPAELIDRLVERGTFASASEVVQAGLHELEMEDEALERWLRDEVVPVVEEMKAHPERAIPSDRISGKYRAIARALEENSADAA